MGKQNKGSEIRGISALRELKEKGQPNVSSPDPEVPEKAVRRRFSATYKKRILDEIDACTEKGDKGAMFQYPDLTSHIGQLSLI